MCCQNKNAEWKTNLVDGCGYKTINTDTFINRSIRRCEVNRSIRGCRVNSVKSTDQLEDVKSTDQSENVKLLEEAPEDVVYVPASIPSYKEERGKPILQPNTPKSTLIKQPQIKVQEH